MPFERHDSHHEGIPVNAKERRALRLAEKLTKGSKLCSTCGEMDQEAFGPKAQYHCKECTRKYNAKRRDKLGKSGRRQEQAKLYLVRKALPGFLEDKRKYQSERFAKRFSTLKGRAKVLHQGAKQRAKERGIPFSISVEFVLNLLTNTQDCPALGLPIWRPNEDGSIKWFATPGKTQEHNSPSLDQMVAGAGYTEDNTELVSWRANHIKNDGTADEHFKIATRMKLQDERSIEAA